MAYQGSFLLGISWLQPVFDAMNAVLNPLVQMDQFKWILLLIIQCLLYL